MVDTKDLRKGFYKVKDEGGWTVMWFDGEDFYDHTSGCYASYDNKDSITEIGDRVSLPDD